MRKQLHSDSEYFVDKLQRFLMNSEEIMNKLQYVSYLTAFALIQSPKCSHQCFSVKCKMPFIVELLNVRLLFLVWLKYPIFYVSFSL